MSGRINNFADIRVSLKAREQRIVINNRGVIPETDPFVRVGCFTDLGREYRHRITVPRFVEPLLRIVGDSLWMTIFIEKENGTLVCVIQDHDCQCSGRGEIVLDRDSLATWDNFLKCVLDAAAIAKANRAMPLNT